ncbi:acetyl-CoA carboxylase biotin carboxylase subunit [Saccharopolyspora lacisalsi]|uniref:biotin carboxylase n=1 Tax=Halosaccharopolyspora lacisalsi TaxID=1000566 RepID=A0A839DQU4_9PSEU|nr:acetyl-CoA carboxylase biotin carboxylase subunit [Halosaccharopolyspora lacisalsi]MBA8823884.1 acetyl-CoA carboxylase biotin carboxylase subunit [Halosaccharopolyspora lacisalsi]
MRRVLVANRGEIAVRVIRAAHAAGIEAVAVHSDADAEGQWVRLADAAVHIGKSAAAKSYLNSAALVEAAVSTGSDAVHPGYGFLSERPGFAKEIGDAGLTFVGPAVSTIEMMGDKAAARGAAERADVPIVPGSPPVATVDEAVAAAEDVGFPVLLKAAAGGGGRGIRPAHTAEELAEVLPAAQAEARSAFNDDSIYLERAIVGARHVEVQVLADGHGNVVHTFERDCSVQRRRQKLIEEAPAPGLAPETRQRINDAAVRLARQVGYVGAGTVEFLLTPDGEFFFIEMNTRIQVEHPISEVVTDVDLVAEQLRIAAGLPLSFDQDDVSLDGAAVELRINAEDPDNDFQPTPGNLSRLDLPGGPGVRVDTGFVAGDRISPFYDSMIAKLICFGPDRDVALARARQALSELHVDGVPSTVATHRRLLDEPELRTGAVHTRWLEGLC